MVAQCEPGGVRAMPLKMITPPGFGVGARSDRTVQGVRRATYPGFAFAESSAAGPARASAVFSCGVAAAR